MDYENLNDVEFEYLCADIMSVKLGTELRYFSAGRDGGIDLRDNLKTPQIIVQVKHYYKSGFSNLFKSLQKEVEKVKKLKPKQYYICCSQKLTAKNIDNIFNLFKDYMDSKANIITLIEINDFLVKPENFEILRKHYKLWLSSTSILENINNNNIFIDCEFLLSNIEKDKQLFVQTKAYDEARECLEKHRCLFITGNPGVGKTMTCKMLVLYFASKGYKVRYTTDGSNLNDLKKSLSLSKEEKEIIFLDDCLGQAYFNMKETQGNELLSIFSYVKFNSNKILLLNSRITIYTEACNRTPELIKSIQGNDLKTFVLDMNNISLPEKAKIFYNHLYFNCIGKDYFEDIVKDKRYFKIIKHDNYNPRIIEFVVNKENLKSIKASEYYEFIMDKLNNPKDVWLNEYNNRLNKCDRILVNTLYSLTNTEITYDLLKSCYEYRIKNEKEIDETIYLFEEAINRLKTSFIKIVDKNGKKCLAMANPSINDFIRDLLKVNNVEREKIVQNAHCPIQIRRLYTESNYLDYLLKLFESHDILKFELESKQEMVSFISFYIAKLDIQDDFYKKYLYSFLRDPVSVNTGDGKIYPIFILRNILTYEIVYFYSLKDFFCDDDCIRDLLLNFELEDLIEVLALLIPYLNDNEYDHLKIISSEYIKNCIDSYAEDNYIGFLDIPIDQIIEDSLFDIEEGDYSVDKDTAVEKIHDYACNLLFEDIERAFKNLPDDFYSLEDIDKSEFYQIQECEDLYDGYETYDSDYKMETPQSSLYQKEYQEIEFIFTRYPDIDG